MGKKSCSRSTGSGGSKGGSSLSRGGSKGGNSVSKATNKVSTTVKATKSAQPGKQTTYKTVTHQAKTVMQKGANSVKTTVTSTVTKAVNKPVKPSTTPVTTTIQTIKSTAVTVTAPKPSTSAIN